MAQKLDPNCGENFVVADGLVIFQALSKGLYRVPCAGRVDAFQLHDYAGHIAVSGDWVFFQAGNKGLYRVWAHADKHDDAVQMFPKAGYLAVPGDGHVYFQAGDDGLYRMPLFQPSPVCLHDKAGYLVAPGDGYIYLQAGDDGLYRISWNGSSKKKLHDKAGYLVVNGDWVFFQAGGDGLYRVKRDGSAKAEPMYPKAGYLAVRDNWVYFQAGGDGLWRIPCTGNAQAQQLDIHCGHLVVPGDGYVYFQSPGHGLYRVLCEGKVPAEQLDENCGNLTIPGDGFIYFQGGPSEESLYRTVQPANFPMPAGLTIRIQDQYDVSNIFDAIDDKKKAIQSLLVAASNDTSNTWFLNFTSGASSGAYPDAVAGRINGPIRTYIHDDLKGKERLGTIIMDFPNDGKDMSYIQSLVNRNPISQVGLDMWMSAITGDPLLSTITIPGTHDSCTFNILPGMSKCQNMSLPEQFAAGIRFIDIRCRHYYDRFELHHGSDYLNLNFDYVLDQCYEFFSDPKHSKECIIMSVKREYTSEGNQKTFQEVFSEYMKRKDKKVSWHVGNTIPKLSAVRGKVVLVRRFFVLPTSKPEEWGIDLSTWPENTTFRLPL
jgi:Domain of unknown function (DUF5050)/Phosphatidylinositol-specific phospholipase C, X domain